VHFLGGKRIATQSRTLVLDVHLHLKQIAGEVIKIAVRFAVVDEVRSWPIAPDRGLQFFGRCWEHSGHWPTLEPEGSVAIDPTRKSSVHRSNRDNVSARCCFIRVLLVATNREAKDPCGDPTSHDGSAGEPPGALAGWWSVRLQSAPEWGDNIFPAWAPTGPQIDSCPTSPMAAGFEKVSAKDALFWMCRRECA
jgi:hypothetical protein